MCARWSTLGIRTSENTQITNFLELRQREVQSAPSPRPDPSTLDGGASVSVRGLFALCKLMFAIRWLCRMAPAGVYIIEGLSGRGAARSYMANFAECPFHALGFFAP